ncbi:MBL fold metallo-hydrolase [Mycobacterium sp. 236(2023)]|uniref:MBL fold metallo-hydrolase n=1 Tax=Mycobacterium sp. 236(2023) TaxID=3038163 RepID=UPI002415202F|nr:MBL fold metallo-hydrolase [Mycobacterium sp. 236(2023)]MDG4669351.1 MBL fold metallo-hydrolase [Mycobacterium sp. 236(2023)]
MPTTISNAYLWRDDDGRVHVVDPGMPGDHHKVLSMAALAGLRIDHTSSIVLTHWHRDHSGAAADLAAATGATVWAGSADAVVLSGRKEPQYPDLTDDERPAFEGLVSAKPDSIRAPCLPDARSYGDGDSVDSRGRAIVVDVAGHTAGSIAIHLTHLNVVVTGDVVINDPQSGLRPGPFNVDNKRAAAQFTRVRKLGSTTIAVGHGIPVHPGLG